MRIRRRLRSGGGYSFDEEMSKSFAELRARVRAVTDDLSPRENVPDIRQVADFLIADQAATRGLSAEDFAEPGYTVLPPIEIGEATLDGIATMADLTVDDLMALAIKLARRIVALTDDDADPRDGDH